MTDMSNYDEGEALCFIICMFLLAILGFVGYWVISSIF